MPREPLWVLVGVVRGRLYLVGLCRFRDITHIGVREVCNEYALDEIGAGAGTGVRRHTPPRGDACGKKTRTAREVC